MIQYWDYSVSSLSSSSATAICDSVTVTTVVSGSVTKWTSLSCASDRSFTLIVSAAIEHDEATTRKIIHRLQDKYEAEDRGLRIIELEDSFQLCTKREMYDYLIRIAKQPKKCVLTDVLLETLSIIAYRQPVTKLEIEKIRGVKSDHAVNKLVEYNLACEVGRLDAPGRPILFGTTEEFLRRFSIQSIEDLPSMQPEQVETFKEEAEEEVQLKLNV